MSEREAAGETKKTDTASTSTIRPHRCEVKAVQKRITSSVIKLQMTLGVVSTTFLGILDTGSGSSSIPFLYGNNEAHRKYGAPRILVRTNTSRTSVLN